MKLKFRRWDKINKVMLQHKDIPVLLKNAHNDNQFEYMLWTGLLDKAGQKIFEGDIIHGKLVAPTVGTMGVIKWDNRLAMWANRNESGLTPLFKIRDIEVIGNIHQNPELTK